MPLTQSFDEKQDGTGSRTLSVPPELACLDDLLEMPHTEGLSDDALEKGMALLLILRLSFVTLISCLSRTQ